MKRASKNRLMPRHRELFPSDSLFDRIARTVCRAGTLPRKELYEAWETARRVRRRFRGGRVVDLACGHGLLAHIMLILDDSSERALAVDTRIPENAGTLSRCLTDQWPRLAGRIQFRQADLRTMALDRTDLVVSAHACGELTDLVLARAVGAGARVAVLPCCHHIDRSDTGGLENWMDASLAVDAVRAFRLREAGYRVITQTIPHDITPKNRLLLGDPHG